MRIFLKKILLRIFEYLQFKKSYSQDGEDVVLASFFEEQKKYKGFFVDIGAHHPIRFSNTFMFYQQGWRGVNIDPTPKSMQPFRFLRRRDTNLEIGIGEKPSNLTFFCFNEPALNTFDEQIAQERNGTRYRIVKTVVVPVEPLSHILDQYLMPNQKIDFLTIDVEGLDLEVLKSNNWSKYKPTFILVEDLDFLPEQPSASPVYQYLSERNYKIVAILKRTIIFRLAT